MLALIDNFLLKILLLGGQRSYSEIFLNGRLYVKNREMPLWRQLFNSSVFHNKKVYNEKNMH